MERYFKKYLWLMDALAVALSAAFLAKATGHLIVSGYLLTDATPPPRAALLAPIATPSTASSFDDIVRRNIFCSTCAPAIPIASSQPTGPDGTPSDAAPTKTSLPLTYVSSFICRSDIRWTFATVEENVAHQAGVFRVGSQLPSGYGWVTDIEPDRVVFQTNGHLEYIPLIATAPATAAPVTASASPLDADLSKGVHKINDFQYQIDRGLLEKVLADTSILAQQVRVVPSVDPATGRPNGFKVYGIRPGSIMSAIGLNNGDTLSAVNGNDISTPDKAVAVYGLIRSASMVAISINRGGQPHELDYTIH